MTEITIVLKEGNVTTLLPNDYEIAEKTIEEIVAMSNGIRSEWYKTIPPEEKAKAKAIMESIRGANISASKIGTKRSDKSKAKMSASAIARFKDKRNHPMYGTTFSEETKAKQRKAWTPERRANQSGENNVMMRPEVLAKCSGENHHLYGKKQLEKTKVKMSATKQRISVSEWNGFLKDDPKYNRRRFLKRTGLPDEFIEASFAQKQHRSDIELLLEFWLLKNEIAYEFQRRIILSGIRRFTKPDFFIQPNICIYVDGEYWHDKEKRKATDAKITQELESMNYIVIRFTGMEIHNGVRPWKTLGLQQRKFEQEILEGDN